MAYEDAGVTGELVRIIHLRLGNRDAARAQLARVRALGDLAAATVVPVWPKRADPTSKSAKRRALEAMGLPVLLSPRLREKQRRAARKPP